MMRAALLLVLAATTHAINNELKMEDFGEPTDAQPVAVTGFSLSKTLGDSMVLQRAPKSAVVWGFAPAGTTVETSLNGHLYTTIAGKDNVWRTTLRPTEVGGGPQTILFKASTGETAILKDVLFGDVYVCGGATLLTTPTLAQMSSRLSLSLSLSLFQGQSNMQFSIGGNINATSYAKEADKYGDIRLFTVGQKTQSRTPLIDLQTVEQNWTHASAAAVDNGNKFGYFSAVCWFFGKNLFDGLEGQVPIGLISNNWGGESPPHRLSIPKILRHVIYFVPTGTPVEHWMPPSASVSCGHASDGVLWNSMIVPYTVGPMAVSGFTWYQGESDTTQIPGAVGENNNYTCTQTAMIESWRAGFGDPSAFYSIVQLSTWLANPDTLADMRQMQIETGNLIPNFAYATNADYGAGGNIHPPFKQYPGARLANAALAIVYNKGINWRSPTYASGSQNFPDTVTVWLHDVLEAGLVIKEAPNLPANAAACPGLNAKAPYTCAWAAIQFNDKAATWVNASVSLGAEKQTLVLVAEAVPTGATKAVATSYGWGAIPMLNVYRADMDGEDGQLPVLPWNRTLAPGWA